MIWRSKNMSVNFTDSMVDIQEPELIYKESNPDIIIFSDCCPISNIAAKYVAAKNKIPYIVICHSVANYLAAGFPYTIPAVENLNSMSLGVICVSNAVLNNLNNQYGLKLDKAKVIYNGRPERFFEPRRIESRVKVRDELGLSNEHFIFLTVARFEPGKGYQLLLKAIFNLKNLNLLKNKHFVWIGEGGLKEAILQSLCDLNLQDCITILPQREDIEYLYDASDFFVLPTYNEGFPLSIIESMAKSLCVIASNVGGVPEVLGNTGNYLPDPNINEEETVLKLTEYLIKLVEDKFKIVSQGALATNRAMSLFKEVMMQDETIRHIEKLFLNKFKP